MERLYRGSVADLLYRINEEKIQIKKNHRHGENDDTHDRCSQVKSILSSGEIDLLRFSELKGAEYKSGENDHGNDPEHDLRRKVLPLKD